MHDIAICWYELDSDSVIVSRQQAAFYASEAGLTLGIYPKLTSLGRFRQSAKSTKITYLDEAGAPVALVALERKRAPNTPVTTIDLHRDSAGGPVLAQLKHFDARRTEAGKVFGTERIKTMVATGASASDQEAAGRWLAAFAEGYEMEDADLQARMVRHYTHIAMCQHTYKFIGRRWSYWCYVDQLPGLEKVRDFLSHCSSNFRVVTLPLTREADRSVFAQSADALMLEELDVVEKVFATFAKVPPRSGTKRALSVSKGMREVGLRAEMHEERLGLPLPRTQARLAALSQMMVDANLSADLRSVKRR